ncbi:MAG TPA: hypothetical protein DEO32_04230 [Ruminococcaceae bacterium]|nr:hypothetical protein [Oscillospiraceae bacterium]
MSQKEWIKFIAMNMANYLLVLFAVLLYRLGGMLYIPVVLIAQSILTVANYSVAKKTSHLIILSVNLLISTIIANVTDIYLYMQNISADSETLLIGKYMVVIGAIFVVVISVIAICVKSNAGKSK